MNTTIRDKINHLRRPEANGKQYNDANRIEKIWRNIAVAATRNGKHASDSIHIANDITQEYVDIFHSTDHDSILPTPWHGRR